MKILIYIIPFLLFGCATKQPIIYQKNINPPPEIMLDCEEFVLPNEGNLGEFLRITIENKKVYELCKNQNKAKKEFIIKQY